MTRPRWPTVIVGNALIFLMLVAVLEGLSSLALLAVDLGTPRHPLVAERAHTQYDPEIGWINRPNIRIEDMYGKGRTLTINSQHFRARQEYAPHPAHGRIRILCSGDSFTLGYGVDDEATWAHLLTTIDKRIETVNLGQGGYGIDQSYLWYLREGVKFDADLHVLAVTGEDFLRAFRDNLMGYGKPVLQVVDGRIVATNVPVPRAAYVFTQVGPLLETRTAHLVRRLSRRGSAAPDVRNDGRIFLSILEDLREQSRRKGSLLVIVYLPMLQDYNLQAYQGIREWLTAASANAGLPLIDLTGHLERVPPDVINSLFIQDDGSTKHLMAPGHYSEAGHRFVAAALYRELLTLSETAALLSPPGQ